MKLFFLLSFLLFGSLANADSQITNDRFEQLVNNISSQYAGDIETLQKNFVVESDWSAPQPSAYTFEDQGTLYFIINGGLARLDELSEGDFSFQLCYRLEEHIQGLSELNAVVNINKTVRCVESALGNAEQFSSWYEDYKRNSSLRISYSQGCKKRWTATWDRQFVQLLKSAGPSLMRTITNIPKDIVHFCPRGKQKISGGNKSSLKNKKAMGLLLETFRSMASAESNCRPQVTAKGATGTAVGLFQMGAHDAQAHKCKTLKGAAVKTIGQLKNAYTNMRCAITIANNMARKSPHKYNIAAGSKGHIGVLGAFWAVVRTKGHGTKPRGMITARTKRMCRAKTLSSHFGNSVAKKINSLN